MAAASAVMHMRTGKEPMKLADMNEPVSFHLEFLLGKNYILPDGKNSVDVLRMALNSEWPSASNKRSPEHNFTSRKLSSYFDPLHFKNKTSKNITGTKMEFWTKKFSTGHSAIDDVDKIWQDRLLIVTEKRIFIVSKKILGTDRHIKEQISASNASTDHITHNATCHFDLEITDSIPVEEITSVQLGSNPGVWDSDANSTSRGNILSHSLARASAIFAQVRGNVEREAPTSATASFVTRNEQQQVSEGGLRRSRAIRQPSSSNTFADLKPAHPGPEVLAGYCEPVLRIATAPGGFNRGQAYYFLLRHQDHPCLEYGGDDGAARRPLRDRADAEALASRLDSHAARRRREHARETRFLRLQA
jgi:hypothetical protein